MLENIREPRAEVLAAARDLVTPAPIGNLVEHDVFSIRRCDSAGESGRGGERFVGGDEGASSPDHAVERVVRELRHGEERDDPRARRAEVLRRGAFVSLSLVRAADQATFSDPVVFTEQTPYQRIVLTRGHGGVNLFLDGNLQFASVDEYRYHEALVQPAMASASRRARVLVLGGGDGLAVRRSFVGPTSPRSRWSISTRR